MQNARTGTIHNADGTTPSTETAAQKLAETGRNTQFEMHGNEYHKPGTDGKYPADENHQPQNQPPVFQIEMRADEAAKFDETGRVRIGKIEVRK